MYVGTYFSLFNSSLFLLNSYFLFLIRPVSKVLTTLDKIKTDRFNGDDVAKSIGIKKVMLKLGFRVAMVVTKKILSMLQPADTALQARSAGLKEAIVIIKCVQNEIKKLRSDEMYYQMLEEAKSTISGDSENKTQAEKRQIIKQVGWTPTCCMALPAPPRGEI